MAAACACSAFSRSCDGSSCLYLRISLLIRLDGAYEVAEFVEKRGAKAEKVKGTYS